MALVTKIVINYTVTKIVINYTVTKTTRLGNACEQVDFGLYYTAGRSGIKLSDITKPQGSYSELVTISVADRWAMPCLQM